MEKFSILNWRNYSNNYIYSNYFKRMVDLHEKWSDFEKFDISELKLPENTFIN